ncbi:TonB-dependent receptor [Sphingopyxis sp.]|uniref:TonB-dependent receptor domain-containing protein n=1 Tax=Sphingopyxis sp. TaxID=1908224 RepID=UPI0026238417|nr:TonB-dependent receptor [Sphingopyxis sp.]MCW0197092.1 TonB-dependent receptor [Sphingopyxis sp.]
MKLFAKAALGACVSVIALSASGTALAQEQDSVAPQESADSKDSDDVILVTGSRIARRGTETVEPVIVLDSASIESRGFSTLGQALSEQPAFGIADSSQVGTQSSFGPGQSFVNFFGLGSQRTLTLVDGRRFVGSNTSTIFGPTGSGGSQVDLNLIPTKLIDRVETVAVGGAPIYGSDAIAGTINVIMKRDFEGFEIDGQYGISDHGDAPDYRFRAIAGTNFADGRGNITFAAEYNKSRGLLYTDRPLSALGRYTDPATTPGYPYQREYYTDRRLPGISENGIPLVGTFGADLLGLNAILPPSYQALYGPYAEIYGGAPAGTPFNMGVTGGGPATQAMRFDRDGNLIPIDYGITTSLTNASGGNGYSLTDLSNLLTNTQRYSGIAKAEFNFSDSVRLFGEAWYTHSDGTNLRDQPEYNSGLFGYPGDLANAGAYMISINNPFLSDAARATIQESINNNPLSDQNIYGGTQDYFFLDRANTDLINGRVKGKVDTYRFVAGLDGEINVLDGKSWKWEVFGNYGRSKTSSVQSTLNVQNLANAVDAIGTSAADATCRPGVVSSTGPTVSNVCAPLNLFGNGQASKAALDYVTMLATPKSVNTQYDFVASLSGPLVSLPGGDLSFAVGYEHRDEHTKFDPSDAFLGAPDADPTVDSNGDGDPTNDRTSYGQLVPIAAIDAGYNTDEIFGELQGDLIGPDNNIPMIYALNFQLAGRYVHNSYTGGAFTWTAGGRWSPVRDLTIRGNFTHSIRSPSITEFANPSQQSFGFADDPCDQTAIDQGPNPTARGANCLAAFQALGLTATDLANYDSLSDERSFLQGTAGDAGLKNETANSWTVGAIFQPTFVPRLVISADYVDIKVKGVISSFGAEDVLSACYDSATYPDNEYCDRVTRDNTGNLSYVVSGYVNADELRYRGIVSQGSYRFPTPFLGAESGIGLSVSYQHLFEISSVSAGTKTRTEGTAGYSKDKFVATATYANQGLEVFAQASYIGPAKIDNYYAEDYQINHYDAVVFTNLGATYTFPDSAFQLRFNVDNVFGTKPPFPSSGTSDVYFRGAMGRFYRVGAAVRF